jgi:hypothetical protein
MRPLCVLDTEDSNKLVIDVQLLSLQTFQSVPNELGMKMARQLDVAIATVRLSGSLSPPLTVDVETFIKFMIHPTGPAGWQGTYASEQCPGVRAGLRGTG